MRPLNSRTKFSKLVLVCTSTHILVMIPLEPKPNEHGNELDKYNTCLIILSINQTSYGQKFEVIEVFVLELPCGFRLE